MKARTWSLIVKICTAVFAIAAFVLKGLGILNITVGEISAICGLLMGSVLTIDGNISLDKITGDKGNVQK